MNRSVCTVSAVTMASLALAGCAGGSSSSSPSSTSPGSSSQNTQSSSASPSSSSSDQSAIPANLLKVTGNDPVAACQKLLGDPSTVVQGVNYRASLLLGDKGPVAHTWNDSNSFAQASFGDAAPVEGSSRFLKCLVNGSINIPNPSNPNSLLYARQPVSVVVSEGPIFVQKSDYSWVDINKVKFGDKSTPYASSSKTNGNLTVTVIDSAESYLSSGSLGAEGKAAASSYQAEDKQIAARVAAKL